MDDFHQPLNDDELNWLDDFLLERIDENADVEGKDEGILDVSELDGLLTAVVSGPVTIPPSKWVPQVWGDFEPVWEDEQEIRHVMTMLMRHMNSIAVMLMEQPGDFEPIFLERELEGITYAIVDEWCEGYMRGVVLAAEQWELDTSEMRELLFPILAFQGTQEVETHDQCSEEEVRVLQNAIPENVRKIHSYWLSKRDHPASSITPHSPTTREQPRIGRNDPCPCGSGKKYKKCCLH